MRAWKTLQNSLDSKVILVAVLYYLSARLGLLMALEDTNTSPVWPPSGLGFALIILIGRSAWPGITIGALIANALVFWSNQVEDVTAIITASTLMAIGNTIEPLFGNLLFKKLIPLGRPFEDTATTIKFLLIASLMSVISPSINTISLGVNGIIGLTMAPLVWFTSWMGDFVGILLITPIMLAWTNPFRLRLTQGKLLETIMFLAILAAVGSLFGFPYIAETIEKSLPFLVIPLLLWLAFSFNLQIAITGILLASIIAINFTTLGGGPFILDTTNSSLLLLQIFIGVISITTLILSATVNERTKAQKTIELFNESLESKIQDRTKELHAEIQERRKAEERIKISNRKLKKTNVELDSFVYSVSHDLRAPIASVKGLLNLIKTEKKQVQTGAYLDMIAKSVDQQDLFIREILDLSRNSRLRLDKEVVNFKKIIQEVFDQLKFATEGDLVRKKIKIKQDSPFISDRRRLKVIFNNLISNAVRYCNGKEPQIDIKVIVEDNKARIIIQDNGRGIGKEHVGHVFEMFYRATETNAGSGLGLYIVKETIDKLRGSIDLNSDEGNGTTVEVKIPGLKMTNGHVSSNGSSRSAS